MWPPNPTTVRFAPSRGSCFHTWLSCEARDKRPRDPPSSLNLTTQTPKKFKTQQDFMCTAATRNQYATTTAPTTITGLYGFMARKPSCSIAAVEFPQPTKNSTDRANQSISVKHTANDTACLAQSLQAHGKAPHGHRAMFELPEFMNLWSWQMRKKRPPCFGVNVARPPPIAAFVSCKSPR